MPSPDQKEGVPEVSSSTRFRKKPLEVHAMQVCEILTRDMSYLPPWVLEALTADPETDEGFGARSRLMAHESHVTVTTKQGHAIDAEWTEWIVCAAPDDLWPVDADVFAASYEPADESEV